MSALHSRVVRCVEIKAGIHAVPGSAFASRFVEVRMSIIIRVQSSSGQRRVTVAPSATLHDVHSALVKDLQSVITVKAAQVSLFADRECTAPFPDLSLSLSDLGLSKNGSMIYAKHPPIAVASLDTRNSSSSPPPARGSNVKYAVLLHAPRTLACALQCSHHFFPEHFPMSVLAQGADEASTVCSSRILHA
jgi:hypothetical protein